jgi:hypothetical protein
MKNIFRWEKAKKVVKTKERQEETRERRAERAQNPAEVRVSGNTNYVRYGNSLWTIE